MRLLVFSGIILLFFTSCDKENGPDPFIPKVIQLSMSENYANDLFMDLESENVKVVGRMNWDLAFSTDPRTSTIRINEGSGAMLYAVPGMGINNWNNVIFADDQSGWQELYNADTTWFFGAFEKNALGHPDYGWGVYNSQTHDVIGDSVMVLKPVTGALKKILIESRRASDNAFVFKYADLDGSNEIQEVVQCSDYLDKNFIYYSITSGSVIDREPVTEKWDMVFTKYHDESIPYIVTGVFLNSGVKSACVVSEDVNIENYTDYTFSESMNVIGSDWKSFDRELFQYVLAENLVYFVMTVEGNVFRIVFKSFAGSSTGDLSFELLRIK